MSREPNLNLIKSKERDFEVFKSFLQTVKVLDVEREIKLGFYEPYPKLKDILKEKNGEDMPEKEVFNFVKDIYEKKEDEIDAGLKETKKRWKDHRGDFLKETSRIFKGHFWPEGKYNGYVSIWGIFPRYLNVKEFTFPYKKDSCSLYVVMHEMLHFIFYDYALKKHPEKFKNLDTRRGLFWDLSEIFNTVILFTPGFFKLHNRAGDSLEAAYSEHKKHLEYFKNLWEKEKDIDIWLTKGHEYYKNRDKN